MIKLPKKRSRRSVSYFLKLALFLLILLLVLYLGVSGYVVNVLTTPVRHALDDSPARAGLQFEAVTFPSIEDNILLKGWLVSSSTPSNKIIIITHGKDANRLDNHGLSIMQALAQRGFNVLAYDSRGHGESGGDRLSLGQNEPRDLLGAVNFVESRHFLPPHIGAIGYSMGGATTILAAARSNDIQAIWTDSAYANLSDLLDAVFTLYSGLPNAFLPGVELMGRIMYNFDVNNVIPEKAIAQLGKRHVYLVQGLSDTNVPPWNVERLAKAAGPSLAGIWKVQGAQHVQSYQNQPDEYLQRLTTFFDTELK